MTKLLTRNLHLKGPVRYAEGQHGKTRNLRCGVKHPGRLRPGKNYQIRGRDARQGKNSEKPFGGGNAWEKIIDILK